MPSRTAADLISIKRVRTFARYTSLFAPGTTMSGQPIDFFHTMREDFGRILAHDAANGTAAAITLADSAFEWFEGNIEIQSAGQPPLACDKGCPTCCALRVTATAPEVFLMAHYIRMVEATPQGAQLQLTKRIILAEETTRGRTEQERLKSGRPCPMLIEEACVLHPVRTLACRGHAAFSEEQCRAATDGQDVDVGVSEAHLTLRALVQSALQAAMRDHGLPWGLYELNQALALTLAEPELIDEWFSGTDGLAAAAVGVDLDALGQAFDELRTIN